jgi:hypothetical protein
VGTVGRERPVREAEALAGVVVNRLELRVVKDWLRLYGNRCMHKAGRANSHPSERPKQREKKREKKSSYRVTAYRPGGQ